MCKAVEKWAPRIDTVQVELSTLQQRVNAEKTQFFRLLDEAQDDLRNQFEQVTLQCSNNNKIVSDVMLKLANTDEMFAQMA